MPHGIDRIEAMGDDAVVVGSDGKNLYFTAVDLGQRPVVAGAFVQRDAVQGEVRSHGFFYQPQTADSGLLGLPIRHAGQPGWAHLVHGSAEVLFLQVADLEFSKLGTLASDPHTDTNDDCRVSCVDWYGNARPIFYRGRIFALLGYELVEGVQTRGRITELRRTNMLDQPRKQPIWKAR